MLLKGFTKYFVPPDPGGPNKDLDVSRWYSNWCIGYQGGVEQTF